MKRLTATVQGRVQGVAFRDYTQQQATRLKVTGWVTNLPNGTVKVVAEGEEEALQQLEHWLHRGSPSARVDYVDVQWAEATGEFRRFGVEY
ncbi:MAG: acylphosphatase [Caldilineaceae bacterium]